MRRALTSYLLSPNKASIPGIGYISLCCWLKGSYRKAQTTQTVSKAIGCSPKTYFKLLLLKKTLTQLTEHG